MTKENIIDLVLYRTLPSKKVVPVSEELKAAIKNLIDRLRESESCPTPPKCGTNR